MPTVEPYLPVTANALANGFANGDCKVIQPGASENGSFTRVVMRTLESSYSRVRWAGMRSPSLYAPNPWVVGWAHVSALLSPEEVDCHIFDTSYDLAEVDSTSINDAEGNLVEIVVFELSATPFTTQAGGYEVLCLRNSVDADGAGHASNVILCGSPKGCDDARDQWVDSTDDGGAVHPMSAYGPEFCGSWEAEVQ